MPLATLVELVRPSPSPSPLPRSLSHLSHRRTLPPRCRHLRWPPSLLDLRSILLLLLVPSSSHPRISLDDYTSRNGSTMGRADAPRPWFGRRGQTERDER